MGKGGNKTETGFRLARATKPFRKGVEWHELNFQFAGILGPDIEQSKKFLLRGLG